MANATKVSIMENGPRFFTTYVTVTGDGSGEVTGLKVIDHTDVGTIKFRIDRVYWSHAPGMTSKIIWDGSTSVVAWQFPENVDDFNFAKIGGLHNQATAPTGDVTYTTSGLSAGKSATIVIHGRKQ